VARLASSSSARSIGPFQWGPARQFGSILIIGNELRFGMSGRAHSAPFVVVDTYKERLTPPGG